MITQSRLIEIRDLEGPVVYRDEMIELANELIMHRESRAKLQDENLTLRSDHDRAMEIVGERIAEIVERLDEAHAKINAVTDLLGEKERVPGALYYATRIAQLAEAVHELNPGWRGWKGTDGAPFPTGAATTVDEVLAAVPAEADGNKVWAGQERDPGSPYVPWQLDTTNPLYMPPHRGDRVRLEGQRDSTGRYIRDGWYDVVGHDNTGYQIKTTESTERDNTAPWMPWLRPSANLKEVRRGAAQLD